MADSAESVEVCSRCGATVYPEHLERHLADKVDGAVICMHCKRELPTPAPARAGDIGLGEPIELVAEEDDPAGPSTVSGGVVYDRRPTAIKSFGGGPGGMSAGMSVQESQLKRALEPQSDSATRCRVFHCKLADGAFVHMSDQINEWADSHEGIRIKFATSCIGVVEGKHADAHLIVTVFY